MAQRFYFDLMNGSHSIRDDEGVDAHDISQAIEEAQVVIREMRENDELALPDDWSLVIRDERGVILRTLALALDD